MTWNLTEFLSEVRGSAKQICRTIIFPTEGAVSTKA